MDTNLPSFYTDRPLFQRSFSRLFIFFSLERFWMRLRELLIKLYSIDFGEKLVSFNSNVNNKFIHRYISNSKERCSSAFLFQSECVGSNTKAKSARQSKQHVRSHRNEDYLKRSKLGPGTRNPWPTPSIPFTTG